MQARLPVIRVCMILFTDARELQVWLLYGLKFAKVQLMTVPLIVPSRAFLGDSQADCSDKKSSPKPLLASGRINIQDVSMPKQALKQM